eukprot:TRINITY_DN5031_c0_g1_i2.p1 TRINITY_DN5031_c0_g1~~TRINITY_DN5031_c0_g1_i2.p1  ORF type:complete len:400 (-),score=48.06 TRINITY_DN5031_c0_g1_i2:431-1630(-)
MDKTSRRWLLPLFLACWLFNLSQSILSFTFIAALPPSRKEKLLQKRRSAQGFLVGGPRLVSRRAATVTAESAETSTMASVARFVAHALGGATFWGLTYALFFKGTEFLTAATHHSPQLEAAAFLTLALLPIILVRSGFVKRGVDRPLEELARAMPTAGASHVVRSAIRPLNVIISSLFIFFSVNLIAQSVHESFYIELPDVLKPIDPNRDGVLTGAELETVVERFTVRALAITTEFQLGLFGMQALCTKPEGHKATGNDLFDRYWRGLELRQLVPVFSFLIMSTSILAVTISGILTTVGFHPRSILAFGGVGGLAFGLASQNLVSNFMSGLLLVVNKPFRVGDTIEVLLHDVEHPPKGEVKKMGWLFTNIKSGNDMVTVPNSAMVDCTTIKIGGGKAED